MALLDTSTPGVFVGIKYLTYYIEILHNLKCRFQFLENTLLSEPADILCLEVRTVLI